MNKYIKEYVKKPVKIVACYYDGTEESYASILQLNKQIVNLGNNKLLIPTLEGDMTASKGDYIIKGVVGEVYPCKPDIFEATYSILGK